MAVRVARRHDLRRRANAVRSAAWALIRAARPAQWTKNLLVFAGVLFAAKFSDVERWLDAFTVFAAYCAASGAAYVVNDLKDVAADRGHPIKRLRPIAAGELSEGAAVSGAAILAGIGLGLAVALGPLSVALLVAFVALQLAYTLSLKHLVFIDVTAIAVLFVIRAAAGTVAVDVRLSPWLVGCTGLLALFLALAKRRAELVLVAAEETSGRPVLDGYSLELVDKLVAVVAAATIVAYTFYAFTGQDSLAMTITIPFVVFGLLRYLYLVHRRDLGEQPEQVLIKDPQILVTVGLWTLTASLILALH